MQLAPAPFPPGIDHAMGLAARANSTLGVDAPRGIASVQVRATRATTSSYDSLTGAALIGMRDPAFARPMGDLALLETVLHEGTHHLIRRHTGWPGLVAGGRPGMLGEGIAQTVAGATLALHGTDERARSFGWRQLDPRDQTVRIGRRELPLSLHVDDLRRHGPLLDDAGGVHVHGGIVQHAHLLLARSIGLDAMLRITGDAIRTRLGRLTGLAGWADGMLGAAELRHGTGSREAIATVDAWRAVGLAPRGLRSGS